MKIDFNEEKHEYTVGGEHIPSVSEILAPLNAERYASINPMVLQDAARRGKAVHELTEAIDYGLDPEEIDPDLDGYVDAYYQFLFDHDVEWSMIEQIVGNYRTEGEPPLYAGTVDRVGVVDGKLAVVDIKTYASMTTESQMTASCQTALYRSAIEDAYDEPHKRYILHLRKDGTYRLIDLGEFDRKRGWNGNAVAWELYEIYRQKAECLAAGKRGKK